MIFFHFLPSQYVCHDWVYIECPWEKNYLSGSTLLLPVHSLMRNAFALLALQALTKIAVNQHAAHSMFLQPKIDFEHESRSIAMENVKNFVLGSL